MIMLKALLSLLTFTAVFLTIQVVVFVFRGRFDIASFLLLLTNMVASAVFELYRQQNNHNEQQARNEQERAAKIDRLRPGKDPKL